MMNTTTRSVRARSDAQADADWELRRVEGAHSVHKAGRYVVYVLAGLLAVGFALTAGYGLADSSESVPEVMGILLLLVMFGGVLRYSVNTGSSALGLLSLIVAAAVTLEVGVQFGAGWAVVLAILAEVAGSVAVLGARVTVWPRAATAVIMQWLPAPLMCLTPVVGGWVAALIGVAAVVTAGVFLLNGAALMRARRTAKTAGLDLVMPQPVFGQPEGVGAPADVRSTRWARMREARQATGAQLAELGPEWVVLHSRMMPGDGGLVDHIVIGPPGIVLIDSQASAATASAIPATTPMTAQVATADDPDTVTFENIFDDPDTGTVGRAVGPARPESEAVRVAGEVAEQAARIETIIGSGGKVPVAAVVATNDTRSADTSGEAELAVDDRVVPVALTATAAVGARLRALPTNCAPSTVDAVATIVDSVMPRGY